jgi:hypothetical protein
MSSRHSSSVAFCSRAPIFSSDCAWAFFIVDGLGGCSTESQIRNVIFKMENHFTVLILLQPVLQQELKLLIAAQVSLDSFHYAMRSVNQFYVDDSSSVGFPGMGYLDHDRRRGKLSPAFVPINSFNTDLVLSKGQAHMAVRCLLFQRKNPGYLYHPDFSDDHGHTTNSFISSYDMCP